ncbi:MAG: SDR family oxidoreductase [Acetobacterales bacterium]
MGELSGRAAIVTGASRGIGAAIAAELAARGAAVMLAARTVEACWEIVDEIRAAGGTAEATACDVCDYDQIAGVVGEAAARLGGPDILVNNAGMIEPIGALEDSSPEAWARNIEVNLLGVYNGIRAVLPRMTGAGGGVIVNISSGAAHRPLEGWSAYCTGKAAVAMLTRATALETEGSGIRVYGFGPGTVDTDMQVAIRASGINPVSRIPRDDLADPALPARAVAWLCGPEAIDLAGQELSIRDGELRRRAGLPPLPA